MSSAGLTAALTAIEEKAPLVEEVAHSIWEYAELSLLEYKSAALYCDVLRREGFAVTENLCNIPTAFSASYGSGKPVIGILAEYDALSGLSQAAGVTTHTPLTPGGSGHGCGHNLLGAGAMAAALGVKQYLKTTGASGTVILYGCPGEEGVASKAFMARDGVWPQLDAALTWHGADCNEVAAGSSNACLQVKYIFHGVAAHAAESPHKGRSALDAVALMNVGIQFLREHMPPDARIHYAVTDTGGVSPNVVQAEASVLYMVRSPKVADAMELQARVDKVAQGAALMTETTLERQFVDGLSETVPNDALAKVLYDSFSALGVPQHTQQELQFAADLAATYDGAGWVPGCGSQADETYKETVQAMMAGPMNDFLLPLYTGPAFNPGSTDVGDVSWQCPTAQVYVAAWPNGCPGHSWQNVSSGGSSVGMKAALHAGKVLCQAAVTLLEQPETLAAAKAEFQKRTASGYVCPIPADAVAKAI